MNKVDIKIGDKISLLTQDGLVHLRVHYVDYEPPILFHSGIWRVYFRNEGITWVRGHIPRDSDEAKALSVARALRFPVNRADPI